MQHQGKVCDVLTAKDKVYDVPCFGYEVESTSKMFSETLISLPALLILSHFSESTKEVLYPMVESGTASFGDKLMNMRKFYTTS